MHSSVQSIVVLTPSIGSSHLARCIESVRAQTYPHIDHLIVLDGPESVPTVDVKADDRLQVVRLPYRTGTNGMNGYRIAAGFAHLINADAVFFLDDDNWIDADHVANGVEALNAFQVDWVFSLRRLVRADGSFLIDDNCDSLGMWRRDAAYRGPADHLAPEYIRFYGRYPFLADTSCLGLRTSILAKYASKMLFPYTGDAVFTSCLAAECDCACTGARTVNYRLRQDAEVGAEQYFRTGNSAMDSRYVGVFPWLARQRCEHLIA